LELSEPTGRQDSETYIHPKFDYQISPTTFSDAMTIVIDRYKIFKK